MHTIVPQPALLPDVVVYYGCYNVVGRLVCKSYSLTCSTVLVIIA